MKLTLTSIGVFYKQLFAHKKVIKTENYNEQRRKQSNLI